MIYWQLFLSFLKIGFFAIGGAYSFLPLLEKEIVEKYHWLGKSEFLDIAGFAKIFPGAISIKYATYTGYKMGGIWGAVLANAANILAPASLIIIASGFYLKFKNISQVKNAFYVIELVVFAMIMAAAFQAINIKQISSFFSILVMAVAFGLFIYTKIDPAFIIIGAGVIGIFCRFA